MQNNKNNMLPASDHIQFSGPTPTSKPRSPGLLVLAAFCSLAIGLFSPYEIANAGSSGPVPDFLIDVVDPNIVNVERITGREVILDTEVFCPSNVNTGESTLCPAKIGILVLELPSVRWSGVEGNRCEIARSTDGGIRLVLPPRFTLMMPMILEEDIVESNNASEFQTNSLILAGSIIAFGIVDPVDPILAAQLSIDGEERWELQKAEFAAKKAYLLWVRTDLGCTDAEGEFGITYTLSTAEPNYQVGDNSTATLSVVLEEGVDQQFSIEFSAPFLESSESDILSLNLPNPPGTASLGPANRQVTRPVSFSAIAEGTTILTSSAAITNVDTGVTKSFSSSANVTVMPIADTIVNSVSDNARKTGTRGCNTGELVMVDGEMVTECTLRSAIETVNIEGSGTISFAIPILPATQVPRIVLFSDLPQIAVPVVIEGTTQSAGKVELFGGLKEINGLILRGGNSFVSGLVLNGFDSDPTDNNGVAGVAIGIADKGNNHIFGNFIGTDISGELSVPNGWGVFVATGANGNSIGGASTEERNIIVATNIGVDLRSDANSVENNYIGTNVAGTASLGSPLAGVVIRGSLNTIGGSSPTRRNIILGELGIVMAQFDTTPSPDGNTVSGNNIGLLADGSTPLSGIHDTGVLIRQGDGNTVRNNKIVVQDLNENSVVLIDPTQLAFIDETKSSGTVSNTTIEGNEIGLTQSGTTTLDNDICLKVGSSRLYAPTDSSTITNTLVMDNQIAGCRDSILVIGDAVSGTRIVANQIGLRFDGSGQLPSARVSNPVNGVLVGASPDTLIDQNQIVGHVANITLIGSDQSNVAPGATENPSNFQAPGLVVTGNTIGLNSTEDVPLGSDQQLGITVFGNPGPITITNNTIAGHSQREIWLVNGSGHVVSGNRIGTSMGANHGSATGILVAGAESVRIGGPGLEERNVIGNNSLAGIEMRPGKNTRIENNFIGTDVGGTNAWSNDVGILAETTGTSGLVIKTNRISGNTGSGVFLKDLGEETVTLSNNFVGTGNGGTALPNAIGISIDNTRVTLRTNRIAFNQQSGILIQGVQPALIERGPIYENNNQGILYTVMPHDPIPIFAGRSAPNANGEVLLIFSARPEEDVDGTMEIYGNDDCSNPEGRVPVLQQRVFRNEVRDKPFLAAISVPESSPIATLDGFTATLTIDDSTSTFSRCVEPVALVDTDNDGVEDFIEDLIGDINDDGIPDKEQSNVTTVIVGLEDLLEGNAPDPNEEEDLKFIAVISEPGTSLSNVVFSDAVGLDLQPIDGETRTILELPSGLVSFEINLPIGSEGTSAEVLIAFVPIPDNQSYIKVPDPQTMSSFQVLPESGDGDRATKTEDGWILRLTDGGEFDTDGVANGVITDPGGPAVLSEPAPSPTEDVVQRNKPRRIGGCSVGTTDELDPTLILITLLSLLAIHRKRWAATPVG